MAAKQVHVTDQSSARLATQWTKSINADVSYGIISPLIDRSLNVKAH
jgi:hypothetical protein